MLSQDQIEHYQKKGYLHLPSAVDEAMLDRLELAIVKGIELDTHSSYTLWVHMGEARIACAFEKLLQSPQPLVYLEALGLPLVNDLMAELMGAGWFPSDGHAVLKQLGAPETVTWHRDLLHSRKGPSCMMGIYLDASEENDGALVVVEGSHLMHEGICEVKEMLCKHLPAKRGDIIVHDQMLAHTSSSLRNIPRRRVVYFTFHHPAQVMVDGHFDAELMALRQDLPALARAVYAHQQAHPADAVDALMPAHLQHELERIQSLRFQPPPASYCFEGPKGMLANWGPLS
jgi:hypothetical protein